MNSRTFKLSVIIALAALCLIGAGPKHSPAKQKKPAQKSTPAAAKSTTNKIFDPKDSKLPTYIESDSLSVNATERVFNYIGNVSVKHGDVTLTADNMEGTYSEQNQIQVITAVKDVHIVKPPGMQAWGQRARYDAANDIVILTENPSIEQQGSILTADKITLYLKENRSEATGQVRARVIKKDGMSLGVK